MSEAAVAPRRFLFVMWEGGGNIPPTMGLAKRLVERGHRVRVISDSCNEQEVRATGCEFTAYTRAPNRTDKQANSTLIKDYESTSWLSETRGNLKIFLDPGYAEDVFAELAARPVDVCVINQLLLGALFAPEKAGVPAVLLATERLISRIPPPGVGLREKASVSFSQFLFQSVLFREAFGILQNTRRSLGLAPLRGFFSYLNNLPRILIMSSSTFDFKIKPGPNMRFVGPLLDDLIPIDDWQSPWEADHPDPLVVVGLSTRYMNQEPLLQNVMDAMAGMQIRGLVALGPSLDHAEFRIPDNVVVRRFLPYAQIFPIASALVTQCGHGTALRALVNGLPMVGIPFGGDQDGNARRVVALGAGLMLDKEADIATIRTAIQRVVSETTFRDNAKALGKIISEDARSFSAVEELEQLAEVRGGSSI